MNKPERADLGQPMGGERKRLKRSNPSLTVEARKKGADVADDRIETLVDILRTNLKDTNATPQQFSNFRLKFIEFLLVFSKEVYMATTFTAPHQLSEVKVGESVKKAKVGEGVKEAKVGEGVKKAKVGEGVHANGYSDSTSVSSDKRLSGNCSLGFKCLPNCACPKPNSVCTEFYCGHRLNPKRPIMRWSEVCRDKSSDSSSEGRN